MNLLCKYYSNQARLANSVQYLSTQPSFRFFCVSGLLVKNKKNFDVITDNVTLVVACVLPNTGKNSMMLMSSDPALRDMDGKMVDTATLTPDPVFYSLCVLLQEKYKASHNPVTVEFRGEHMSAAVSIDKEEDGALHGTVHSANGDIMVRGDQNIRDLMASCDSIHSFKYTVDTPDCHREVLVKKGRTDILREISRYLSRTLVLVAFQPDGDMLEQYVSTSALLEVITKSNGTRIYQKVNGPKLRDMNAFCVYQSVAKIDDILREQGRALYVAKRG